MKSRLLLMSVAGSIAMAAPALAATTATPAPAPAHAAPASPAHSSAPAAGAPSTAHAATPPAPSTSHPSAAAAAPAAAAAASAAATLATYRNAQEKLKTLKLYAGPIDGTRNAAYVQALQRFQRAHRLPATGRLSAETRSALGIS